MRRILCVILLGGLLLTMLSGCTSREPSSESGSESRTASASEPLSPEDSFYEEVLRTLGAEKTEDGLLVATPCSLLTVNWAEPEDLEGYRYCHWNSFRICRRRKSVPDTPRLRARPAG